MVDDTFEFTQLYYYKTIVKLLWKKSAYVFMSHILIVVMNEIVSELPMSFCIAFIIQQTSWYLVFFIAAGYAIV